MKHIVGPVEFNYELFTIDNKPMKFYLEGFEQGDFMATAKIIEAFGGKLSNSCNQDVITVFRPNHSSKLLQHNYYDVKFLLDSVAWQELQQLENYRLTPLSDDVLKSPPAKRRRESRSPASEIDGTDDSDDSSESEEPHNEAAQQTTAQKTDKTLASCSSPRVQASSSNVEDCLMETDEGNVMPEKAGPTQKESPKALEAIHTPLVENKNQANVPASEITTHVQLEVQKPSRSSDKENDAEDNSPPTPDSKADLELQDLENPQKLRSELEMPMTIEASAPEKHEIPSKAEKMNSEEALLSSDPSVEDLHDQGVIKQLQELEDDQVPSSSTELPKTTELNENSINDLKTEPLLDEPQVSASEAEPLSTNSSIIDPQASLPKTNEFIELGEMELVNGSLNVKTSGEKAGSSSTRETKAIPDSKTQQPMAEDSDSSDSSTSSCSSCSSDDESGIEAVARRTRLQQGAQKPPSYRIQRDVFSKEDDRRMIQFLIEKNAVAQGGRVAVWQEFLKNEVLDKLTTSPAILAKHFNRVLRKNAHKFTDDPTILREFDGKPSQKVNYWTEAEFKVMIDFLMENNFSDKRPWTMIWKECLQESPLLQESNRTVHAIGDKFRRYLRHNYTKYTNDPKAVEKITAMSNERSSP